MRIGCAFTALRSKNEAGNLSSPSRRHHTTRLWTRTYTHRGAGGAGGWVDEGADGYAVEQSGDRWASAVKGNNRAIMVCGLNQGRSTQLSIFVAGENPEEDKNRLQAEMQRRFRR